MTSIVAVGCADGVVVGTDSSSTFAAGANFHTIEQPTEKLQIIGGEVILAGTGQVGLGQRFGSVIEKKWFDVRSQPPIEASKRLAAAGLQDFGETGAPRGQYGAIVAFPCRDESHLCEFAIADFQPELKTQHIWYVSMGSAQLITDPFLGFLRDIFWTAGRPRLQDGIFSVVWTLEEAVRLNPGGVNGPIRLAVLEKTGERKGKPVWQARRLPDDELDLHRQAVAAARDHLRQFKQRHQPEAATGLPAVPESTAVAESTVVADAAALSVAANRSPAPAETA